MHERFDHGSQARFGMESNPTSFPGLFPSSWGRSGKKKKGKALGTRLEDKPGRKSRRFVLFFLLLKRRRKSFRR